LKLLLHFAPAPGMISFVRGWLSIADGSVHRYVPPTLVTSGSDAGQLTVGCSMNEPPGDTGVFFSSGVPSSPDDANTVTPFAYASWYA
jgi:hypothetical protein